MREITAIEELQRNSEALSQEIIRLQKIVATLERELHDHEYAVPHAESEA